MSAGDVAEVLARVLHREWCEGSLCSWGADDMARAIPLAAALAPLIEAEKRAAVAGVVAEFASDFAHRATVYEAHPEHDTDRYLDGFSTGMRLAEKIVCAALAAQDATE